MTFEEFKQQCAAGTMEEYPYMLQPPEGLQDLIVCYQEVIDSITLQEVETLWYLRHSSFGTVRQFHSIAHDLYEASRHFTDLSSIGYYDFCYQAGLYNESRAIEKRKLEERADEKDVQ